MAAENLVVRALRDPAALPGWTPAQWDLLVRQARSAGLLARVADRLNRLNLADAVPPAPAVHLQSALTVAAAQHTEVRREIAFVQHALRDEPGPLVLLKGAAYLMAGLPPAAGRVFSDTDILVPRERLGAVEAALLMHGWATTHHTPYDQRYYREWMHELPPLVHLKRQTALDVHHGISPLTARIRTDGRLLLQAAQPIPGQPGLAMLAPPDMVLHSMLHLLVNDELSHALRDLSDLDLLLRHFGSDPAFWPRLVERAREQGLGRVLHYGLRFVVRVFQTPVPADTLQACAAFAPGPNVAALMDALWQRAALPPHHSVVAPGHRVALFMLYVRAHWLRMPTGLLLRHLTVKALRGREAATNPQTQR